MKQLFLRNFEVKYFWRWNIFVGGLPKTPQKLSERLD